MEKISKKNYQLEYRPTFIVAPPRAGTTFVRQLVTWAIATSYFSNLTQMSQLVLERPLPITTARLARWLPSVRRHGSFESEYGQMRGMRSPAEGELIWGQLFGEPYGPVDPRDVTADRERLIYQAIAATERAFDLPFVGKTSILSLRIRALVKIFPGALFIHVSRDPLDTAQSIFRARKDKYPEWFGAKPRECENLAAETIIEQVCKQVHYVEKNIAYERSVVGEDRFMTISYRELCEDSRRGVKRIAEFMERHGVPARIIQEVPESSVFSHGRKVAEDDYLAMKECFSELE